MAFKCRTLQNFQNDIARECVLVALRNFDLDIFTSFEGDTGPYLLYTIVRMKSILNKYVEQGGSLEGLELTQAQNGSEKALMMQLAGFNAMMANAAEEIAPHKVCAFIYDTANAFNHFYHETKILGEEDETRKKGLIALLSFTKNVMETCLSVLAIEAPEHM